MFSLPDPTLVGVKETLQVAWFEPSDDRLQGLAGVKPPGPSLENVTWPVGLVAPVVAVSVTVAVHDVALPSDWRGTGDRSSRRALDGRRGDGGALNILR